MAAVQFQVPYQAVVVEGAPVPNAKLHFYLTGTSSPLASFTTSALSIAHPNPVPTDAAGKIPPIYLDNTKTYRLVIKNRLGDTLYEQDPFIPGTVPAAGVLQPYADAAAASAAASSASATAAGTSAANANTSAISAAASASAADISADTAEAAAAVASTSIATVPNATAHAATRTALAGLLSGNGPVFLREAGREGMFVWDSSNLSAFVTADTAQGIYVAPASAPTGASGAWVRKFSGPIDIRWFGYAADDNGTAGTDNAPFIAGAIAVAEKLASNATNAFSAIARGGPTILFPVGAGYCSATIEPLCTLTLRGHGGLGEGAATRLRFPSGVTAVRTQASNTVGAGSTGAAHYTSSEMFIEDIHFEGGATGANDADFHGIHARATVHLSRCTFAAFQGEGFYAVASIGGGGALEGNANSSSAYNCAFHNNRNGVLLGGADTNDLKFVGCTANGNRQWGFNDASFLGSHFYGCHTMANTSGPYRTSNVNNFSTFVGCYSEPGQPASSFVGSTVVIGGHHGAGSTGGTRLIGPNLTTSDGTLNQKSDNSSVYYVLQSTGQQHLGFQHNSGGGYFAQIRGAYGDGPILYYELLSAGFQRFNINGATILDITSTGLALAAGKTITASGSITSSGGGIGYATGAGGTVTQATSKSTGVTLNKVCGEITMNAASLAANTAVTFTLTNSQIAAGDRIIVNHASGGTFGAYIADARAAAGSATVMLRNLTAGALAEAVVLGFTVIKGVTA
jgi:hypothetical protein